MKLSHRVFYVWKRNLYSFKRFVIPTVLVSLGEPLFYLIAMGMGLGAYMGLFGGQSYLTFLVPGMIMASAMLSSAMECVYGSFLRMIHEKIYDSLIVTPMLAEEVVAGDILWGVTRGLFSGCLMFLVALGLGVVSFSLPAFILLFAAMAAIGLVFGALSMMVTAFAPNFDFFSYYTELVITPIFFFSNVFFPLDKFPAWVQILSQLSPLTQAVTISRAALTGNISLALGINFLALLIPGAVFLYLAIYFMKRRLIQ